ncbi:MAG: hypothetical protein NDF52_05660 [archaeon YNP-WB-062]|nr:hypothetical protein [Candidatus Culexarchaeum yellowstonense]
MGGYRGGQARFKKYSDKFVPETISARFTQVKDTALARAQEGLLLYASVQEIVRPILDKYGITGTDRAKYLGFANKLLSHTLRASGDAASAYASGLKSFYVTSMKSDPAILDEIIQVVTGWVAPY